MLSQTQNYLLELIKASTFDNLPLNPSKEKLNDVLSEAISQTVLGLISPLIQGGEETSVQYKAMYMRIMYEHAKLLECFESAKIPCVILKGVAAAVYYPRPYLRTMGDIDVLVPKNYFLESLNVLESNGYIYDHGKGLDDQITDMTRELTYTKNGIIVEIHQRFSSPGVSVDDILEDAIDRRDYIELNGFRLPVLPVAENGLVLLGHVNQHLVTNTLGLRQIIDWEMYVHSNTDNSFWSSEFIPLAEKTGLLKFAANVTYMCNKYLGLPEKIDFGIEVDDELADELIQVVMTDGNFGRRAYADNSLDEERVINASYGIKRDGFFKYFTHVGMVTSSFCRKHPSLKVFAFFTGTFRQLRMGICALFKNIGIGRKMSEGKKMYEVHSKRHELFEKLGARTEND